MHNSFFYWVSVTERWMVFQTMRLVRCCHYCPSFMETYMCIFVWICKNIVKILIWICNCDGIVVSDYSGGGENDKSLLRRHNGRDSVSNHQHHDCLLNHLFRRRSKKKSKLRVTGLCAGNTLLIGQMDSTAEDVFIWWRHHVFGLLLLTWICLNPSMVN